MRPLIVEPRLPSPDALHPFLASWPYKPHRWNGTEEGLLALVLDRVRHGLSDDGAGVWTSTAADRITGLATVRPLPWDSRVLGMRAARLELFVSGSYGNSRASADALLAAALNHARRHGVQHLSARVDAGDDPAIHGLESSGFLNVDALMTFGAGIGELAGRRTLDGIDIRPAAPGDEAAISSLAATSFRDGRFHADPSVPEAVAREVYRQWALACCTGSAADATLVAADDSGPVGFIACRMLRDTAVHLGRPTGTITLIASGERARGRGVGFALVTAAAGWFRAEHASAVEVGTQLRNVSAARLYQRCGFRIVAGSLSFRLVMQP